MPRFHVLGSAGRLPTPQRQTRCHLLETRRALVFFDAGSGISRLHDPMLRMLVAKHTRALVLLSGFGFDQVSGITALPFFLGGLEVTVAAPPVAGKGPRELLERLTAPPFAERAFSEWGGSFPRGLEVVELVPGRQEVLGEEVDLAALDGSGAAFGLRVRDVCYLAGRPDPARARPFAAGARLLVHDALTETDAGPPEAGLEAALPSAAAAARLAAEAEVADLLLASLNPAHDAMRLERLVFEASALFPRTFLATDMAILDVRAASADEEESGASRSPDAEGEVAEAPADEGEGARAPEAARTAVGTEVVEEG